MDMASATTRYITDTGRGYIDMVAAFQGASRTDAAAGITTTISSTQIQRRALDLAVSPGRSIAQREALQELVEYGNAHGVIVNIIEIAH